ncbi:uncharacterized protein BDR25DRAFT_347785 [Lindgomyces ingoldianus]|uniref:Uncharacterized protein n=1 Tax=Lindgomyces ingoldianus TaxID=673940 RepID=A0ACB6RDQ3_9PLEO|nr:uncharacterized protein BDR25DRAFT_347785 [Lindgomyces ingoldianus]KAF2477418.1 hypothetical protein BDR25DRAFT_347785 [Lindgomyces ingoldianus]
MAVNADLPYQEPCILMVQSVIRDSFRRVLLCRLLVGRMHDFGKPPKHFPALKTLGIYCGWLVYYLLKFLSHSILFSRNLDCSFRCFPTITICQSNRIQVYALSSLNFPSIYVLLRL